MVDETLSSQSSCLLDIKLDSPPLTTGKQEAKSGRDKNGPRVSDPWPRNSRWRTHSFPSTIGEVTTYTRRSKSRLWVSYLRPRTGGEWTPPFPSPQVKWQPTHEDLKAGCEFHACDQEREANKDLLSFHHRRSDDPHEGVKSDRETYSSNHATGGDRCPPLPPTRRDEADNLAPPRQ